jgi:hypothetical protein
MNMAATIAAAPAKTPATSSMINSATLDPISAPMASASRSVFAAQGLLIQLRAHHPTGCLVAELVQGVEGSYIVRALVQVEGTTIASAMAGAGTIETAEDQARSRVLAVLGIAPLNLEAAVPHTITVPNTVPAAMRLPEIAMPAESVAVGEPTMEPEAKPEPTTTKATRSKARKTTVEKVEPVVTTEPVVATEPVVTTEPVIELEPMIALEPVVEAAVVAAPEPAAVLDVPRPPSFVEESVEITGGDEEIEYEFTFEGDDEPEVEAAATAVAATVVEEPVMDLSDAIMQIGAEIDRIGWTKKQGSSYLQETYGKRTRVELTQAELMSFLNYLKSLPAKVQPALGDLPF